LFSWLLHFVLQFLFPHKNKQQQTRNKARQRNIIKESEGNDTKRKDCNMYGLLWNPSNYVHKVCTAQQPWQNLLTVLLLCLQHVSARQKRTITSAQATYKDNIQDVSRRETEYFYRML
jgi:hypothetical protein